MPKRRTSELLREGCKSYHQALFAVWQFRSEAEAVIRDALGMRLNELASALQLDAKAMRSGLQPTPIPANYSGNYDGSEAEIGVRYPAKEQESKWCLYFYVYVSNEVRGFYTQLWLKEPGTAIFELLSSKFPGLESEERDIWLSEPFPTDGPEDLAAVCDRVLDRWIELWQKAGGLRQFLPDERSGTTHS